MPLPDWFRPGGKHFKHNPARKAEFDFDRETTSWSRSNPVVDNMPNTRTNKRGAGPPKNPIVAKFAADNNVSYAAAQHMLSYDESGGSGPSHSVQDLAAMPEPPMKKPKNPWEASKDNEFENLVEMLADLPDGEQDAAINGGLGGTMTGNTNQSVPGRTLQRYVLKDGTHVVRHKCESTYKLMSKVSTKYDNKLVDFIPWESIRLCHPEDQYMQAFQGATAWRPISARVELFNMRAHAEIQVATQSFYPVNLDQVRLRFIKHSFPIAPRMSIVETKKQFDDWITVTKNQDTGVVTKSLPTTTFRKGVNFDWDTEVWYDDPIWSSKKVVDDEMVDFSWHGKGPWRHTQEFTLPPFYRGNPQNGMSASVDKPMYYGETRFDYAIGAIDPPFVGHNYIKRGSAQENQPYSEPSWFIPMHSINTPNAIKWINDRVDKLTDYEELDTVYPVLRTGTDKKLYFGNHVFDFHHKSRYVNLIPSGSTQGQGGQLAYLMPEPYYDDNVQKPILMTFSRFMKNDNVQEYRVYFDCRIIHEYETRIEPIHNKNMNNHGWAFKQVGLQHEREVGPVGYFCAQSTETDATRYDYLKYTPIHKFYRPIRIPVYFKEY